MRAQLLAGRLPARHYRRARRLVAASGWSMDRPWLNLIALFVQTHPYVPLAMGGLYVAGLVGGFRSAPLGSHPPMVPAQLALLDIAGHNLRVIAILSLGGMGLCVPTVIAGAWNGFLTGSLLAAVLGTPAWFTAVMAHGLPEVVGQWCAMVGGAELCIALLAWLRRGESAFPGRAAAWIGAAVIATCFAALIESTLSPHIILALSR